MACTADFSKFEFGSDYSQAFAGKRVLITGSGKDGGIGQAVALAAALNGAEHVGIHFHGSYRDAFDFVDALRDRGVNAFALQSDVTSMADLWASRSHIIEQMGGKGPDILMCSSGLTEKGYRYGRALPEIEGESRAERRARVRRSFLDHIAESKMVMDTKINGFFSWTHLWAGEAVYHEQPIQFIYASSMQAIEPGIAVPGYVMANWAVLRLPEILKVNLGRASNYATACCLMLPFVRTGMTEEYADNPKVFERWQPRMLETHEAAKSITELLKHPAEELDQGLFKIGVGGTAEDIELYWSKVQLEPKEERFE